MDIGSSNITVYVGTRGVNNTFFFRGQGETEYSGFYDGEFLDPENLRYAMGLAISNAEATSKRVIEFLYIGVPSEFLYVECSEVEHNFEERKRIREQDLSELYSKSINKKLLNNKTLINCSPIWYVTDDNRKTFNIERLKTKRLRAKLSLTYVGNDFIDIINKELGTLGIESVEYISSPLAESEYLLTREERNRKAIIVDVDYLTTSVIEAYGEGLMALNTFPIGGGHITADLSEGFGLSVSSAETLKNDIILSLNSKRTDNYEVFIEDKILPVPVNSANQIVMARIEMIASLINKCLQGNLEENSEISVVYLTGRGLSYINGARDYLAKCLGKNVKQLTPVMPSMAKPHLSSPLSILFLALKRQENNRFRWLKNFNIRRK
jgi:cell division protein FtsA